MGLPRLVAPTLPTRIANRINLPALRRLPATLAPPSWIRRVELPTHDSVKQVLRTDYAQRVEDGQLNAPLPGRSTPSLDLGQGLKLHLVENGTAFYVVSEKRTATGRRKAFRIGAARPIDRIPVGGYSRLEFSGGPRNAQNAMLVGTSGSIYFSRAAGPNQPRELFRLAFI